jgi:hypothetical protein
VNTLSLESRADAVTIGQMLLDKGEFFLSFFMTFWLTDLFLKGNLRATSPSEPFTDSASIYTHS